MNLDTLTQASFLGNPLVRWAIAAAVAVGVVAALRLVRYIIRRRLTAVAARTKTSLDDILVELLANTRSLLFGTLGIYAGSTVLSLSEPVRVTITRLLIVVLVIQAGIWGNIVLRYLLDLYRRQDEDDASRKTTASALSFISRLILYAVLLLLALENFGVDVTALIAGLGITSLAVALALQNILGDLFASLSIVVDKPFEIGDFIIVGDHMGSVENVGLRTTRVRSLSGEELVFANNDLLTSRIRNYKRMAERRVVFSLGVVYQTPREHIERIPSIVRETVTAQQDARFDRCHFKTFGAFALEFETVYYMTTPDYARYMDVQQAINLAIHERFETLGIVFAYPSQTLFLEGLAPPTQGVPVRQP